MTTAGEDAHPVFYDLYAVMRKKCPGWALPTIRIIRAASNQEGDRFA